MYSRATQRVWCVALALLFPGLPFASAQTAGSPASATTGTPYRVLRSIAGASGHEDNSKFMMDDARSLFNAGKDSKVIVYFEWEGPLGPHHFEGLWKSPEGKIVLISDFRYEAKSSRYSALIRTYAVLGFTREQLPLIVDGTSSSYNPLKWDNQNPSLD